MTKGVNTMPYQQNLNADYLEAYAKAFRSYTKSFAAYTPETFKALLKDYPHHKQLVAREEAAYQLADAMGDARSAAEHSAMALFYYQVGAQAKN
jgi:hypothetical protein